MSNINIRLEGVDKLKLNLSSEKYRVKANNIVRKNAANLQDKIKTNMSLYRALGRKTFCETNWSYKP